MDKTPENKRVEIKLTEQLVAGDTPPEIDKKRDRLKASLVRHGVPEADCTIEEGWLAGNRVLIGTGMGTPIEMTDEMEARRKKENEEASQQALVEILKQLSTGQGVSADPKSEEQLAEAKRLNEETKALLAEMKSLQAGAVPVPSVTADEAEAAAKAAEATAAADAGPAATKAKASR